MGARAQSTEASIAAAVLAQPLLAFDASPAHGRGSRALIPRQPSSGRDTVPLLERAKLNELERLQRNAGRVAGYLQLSSASTDSVRSLYYHHCVTQSWPYIALDRDGVRVYVDVTPVAGVGAKRNFAAAAQALRHVQAFLVRTIGPSVQVLNTDTLMEQAKKLAIGALEGSNAFKIADAVQPKAGAPASTLSPSFYVCTTGKAHSRRFADALVQELQEAAAAAGVASAWRIPSPIGRKAARAVSVAKLDKARERRVQVSTRRLTQLAANPAAMKNLRVRAGVMDGFIRAQQARRRERQAPVAVPADAVVTREA